jgi:hypothetical protein
VIHSDRLLAISFVGVAGLLLIYLQHLPEAMFLLGAMAVWAFKNGVTKNTLPSGVDSAANATGTAKLENSFTSEPSTENSLLSLADEGYEGL